MSRPRLQVVSHLSYAELVQRYETCQDARTKAYWQTILLLSQQNPCLSVEEVATSMQFSTDWVRKIAHRYNQLGPTVFTENYRQLRKRSRR